MKKDEKELQNYNLLSIIILLKDRKTSQTLLYNFEDNLTFNSIFKNFVNSFNTDLSLILVMIFVLTKNTFRSI